MAHKGLILLTGATGFIGFKTLILALEAGYAVRCAIRDPKKERTILSNPAITSLKLAPNALTFTSVPDITAPGAYTEAIRNVTHVIHVASPLPAANPTGYQTAEDTFIKPAVRSALEILEAAKNAGTVRQVVITSSVTAIFPDEIWRGVVPQTQTLSAESRIPTPEGPFPSNAQAYAASKAAQFNAVEEWVSKSKPTFSLVTMHPAFVIGRSDLASTVEELWAGTNRFALDIAVGKKFDGVRSGACVHVDDVARAHVLVLDKSQEGSRTFVISAPARWDDVVGIVEREFKDAVEEGVLSTGGGQGSAVLNIRGDEVERVLGFRYLSFEEQVKSVVGQYLELKSAGK